MKTYIERILQIGAKLEALKIKIHGTNVSCDVYRYDPAYLETAYTIFERQCKDYLNLLWEVAAIKNEIGYRSLRIAKTDGREYADDYHILEAFDTEIGG